MKNLIALEKFISTLGWFQHQVRLIITVRREFEGFYGKASEDWETQVSIEIDSPDEKICPNIKFKGARFEDIEGVSIRAFGYIHKWKLQNL